MPACEWCGEPCTDRRRTIWPFRYGLRLPARLAARTVLYVCPPCRRVMEGARREAGG